MVPVLLANISFVRMPVFEIDIVGSSLAGMVARSMQPESLTIIAKKKYSYSSAF